MVVPHAPLAHPPGAHVAGRVEAVRGPIEHERRIRGVAAVLVAVPPAVDIPPPAARLRRGARSTHANSDAGAHRRLGRVGHRDGRLPGTHGADDAVLVDRCHGLVRGGPHHVGHVRVIRLVSGAHRRGVANRHRGRLRRHRQRRHRNRRHDNGRAPAVHRPIPRLQVQARGVLAQSLRHLRETNLVVLVEQAIVCASGRVIFDVPQRHRTVLAQRETVACNRRGIGQVEGQRARVPLARDGHVRDRGSRRIQPEAVAGPVGLRRRAIVAGLDRDRVTPIRQLVAVGVIAVEARGASGRHELDVVRGAPVVVVDGLIRTVARDAAQGLAGLVRQSEGQRGDGAQQHRFRADAAPGPLLRGTRDDDAVGVNAVRHPRILLLEGVGLAERHDAVRDRRPVADLMVVRPLLIEDVGRAPRPVEAHVGHRQVGLPVGAREGHRAVDECSVGSDRVRVRGEGIARSHRHGHRRAGGGGHGHGVRRERQVNAPPRPVGRVPREQPVLNVLGQRLAAERVGVGSVGDVRQVHLEGPALRAIPQVGLRAGGVSRAHHGRIHGRGRGRNRVHEARSDAPRRVEGPVLEGRVRERVSGTHQEIRDQSVLLGSALARESGVGRDALTHEGRDPRDLGRGLGRSALTAVIVARGGGHDPTAGCRELRLETQVGGGSRGGEVGGLDVRGDGERRRGAHGDLDVAGRGSRDRLAEGVPIRLGDGSRPHAKPAIHVRLLGGVGVSHVCEHETGGLAGERLQVLQLVLELDVAPVVVGASPVFEDDRARQVPVVRSEVLLQVRRRTVSGVHNPVGSLRETLEAGRITLVHPGNGAVADASVTERHRPHDVLLADRGHRQGGRVGRGDGDHAVVRVAGVASASVVSSGRVHRDARCVQGLVHLRVQCLGVRTHPLDGREGHGEDVGGKDSGVIEGGQERAVAGRIGTVLRHLRDDELSPGSRALECAAVGGREGRGVRALDVGPPGFAPTVIRPQDVRVAIPVVVGEGNLIAHPRSALAGAQLAGHCGDRILREAQRGGVHGPREGLVRGVEASVDNLNDLPLTRQGGPVRACHLRGRPHGGGIIGVLAAVDSPEVDVADQRVAPFDERALNAGRGLDGRQGRTRRRDREALEDVMVVPHILDTRARLGLRHGVTDALLRLGVAGGLVAGLLREPDDDGDRRVIRRLVGRRDPSVGRVGREGGRHTDGGESEGTGRE